MSAKPFEFGLFVATKSIGVLLEQSKSFKEFIAECVKRYSECDFGELCVEDIDQNNRAMESEVYRIFASYDFPENHDWNTRDVLGMTETKIWIITECDRSATTILFPSEY